jgi:hypothetical protein
MDNLNRIAGELQSPSIGMDKLAQYAQGTNPLIPQYMALAEIQRRQDLTKLEPGQTSTTTVAQDLVTKALAPQMSMGMQGMTPQTAPQQAPQGVAGLQAPQGVAALPTGMGQQSFAGGGIVAFAGDTDGSEVKDPYADLSFTDKLKTLRAAEDQDVDLSKNAMFRRNMAIPGMPTFGSFSQNLSALNPTKTTDVEAQPGGFYGGKAPNIYQFADAHPNVTRADIGAAEPGASTGAGAPTGAKATKGSTKASDAASQLGITQAEAPTDMFGRYQKMYDEQKAQAAADKDQSKWMRLLEAGLGIMGGTSPFAAVNIGQGATQAVKGAAADIAANRKEQAEANKDLATIGMHQEQLKNEIAKTGITKQHYEDWARLEAQKNSILAANANKQGIANDKNVVAMMKTIAASADGIGKSPSQLRAMALESLGLEDTSGGGGATAVGTWTPSGGYKPNKG